VGVITGEQSPEEACDDAIAAAEEAIAE
jgi:hypothetical protein